MIMVVETIYYDFGELTLNFIGINKQLSTQPKRDHNNDDKQLEIRAIHKSNTIRSWKFSCLQHNSL